MTYRRYILGAFASILLALPFGLRAVGLDPARCSIFVQSEVPEHTELAWLFNAVTPVGDLERMTQYKDKSARLTSIPAGLLNYPILQAADILIYRAQAVPVGEDQLQHLELTREIARKWNAKHGEFFPEPQAIVGGTKRIMGLDGYGLSISDRVPIQCQITEHNQRYLQTKKDKLGHLFTTF